MYQPCGTDTLQPAVLKGTGFSSKVATNEDVLDVGVGVDEGVVGDVELGEHAANDTTVTAIARVAAFRFTLRR